MNNRKDKEEAKENAANGGHRNRRRGRNNKDKNNAPNLQTSKMLGQIQNMDN